MFTDTDVKLIGQVDSSLIDIAASVCINADWTSRKYARYEETLKEGRLCTLPYPIRNDEQKLYSTDQLSVIESVLPLVDEISKLFPGYVKIRGEVVNLLPGKELVPHIDVYWFHKYSHRIHVPICTNTESYQIFEDRLHHLECGYIYEINNRIMHSAYNKGDTARIHLIVDLMSPDKADEALCTPGLALTKI